MRAIDFSHKITPRKVIFAKIQKNFFSEVLLKVLISPLKGGPLNERSLYMDKNGILAKIAIFDNFWYKLSFFL